MLEQAGISEELFTCHPCSTAKDRAHRCMDLFWVPLLGLVACSCGCND